MMTIKISPEAREARKAFLKFMIETLDRPCSEGDMIDDRNEALDALFQSLINSTLERAAKKVDDAMKAGSNDVQYNQGCFDSAWIIRQLMRGE